MTETVLDYEVDLTDVDPIGGDNVPPGPYVGEFVTYKATTNSYGDQAAWVTWLIDDDEFGGCQVDQFCNLPGRDLDDKTRRTRAISLAQILSACGVPKEERHGPSGELLERCKDKKAIIIVGDHNGRSSVKNVRELRYDAEGKPLLPKRALPRQAPAANATSPAAHVSAPSAAAPLAAPATSGDDIPWR